MPRAGHSFGHSPETGPSFPAAASQRPSPDERFGGCEATFAQRDSGAIPSLKRWTAFRERPVADVVIENPILNSPFEEPRRHFKFSDEGITNEIAEARSVSSYFVPIPAAKKKGKRLAFETEWTKDRIEENRQINRIRERVSLWRTGGHAGHLTSTTRRLGRARMQPSPFIDELGHACPAPMTGDAWREAAGF